MRLVDSVATSVATLLFGWCVGCSSGETTAQPDASGPDGLGVDSTSSDSVASDSLDFETLPDTGPTLPLVVGLKITEVSVSQGVEISLYASGKDPPTNIPVVPGRPGLVRAYVEPQAGFGKKTIRGELQLRPRTGVAKTFVANATISAASDAADLASTLTWEVPADVFLPGMTWSIALRTPGPAGVGDTSGALAPTSGIAQAIGAEATGDTLKVILVPVRYDGDGSGRTPDLSPARVEGYRKRFLATYPTKNVEITVAPVLPWNKKVLGSFVGWSDLLAEIVKKRTTESAPRNTFHHAVIAPAPTFDDYCIRSCTTGLGELVEDPTESERQASLGCDFGNEEAYDTAIHEVGHTHGRSHAPCDASGYDPDYPYAKGGIGVWGYDITTKTLIDPSVGKDMMGYCDPYWVSDYTWEALFRRQQVVSTAARVVRMSSMAFLWVHRDPDGHLRRGPTLQLPHTASGIPTKAAWIGADGTATDVVATFRQYPDKRAGYYLVPVGDLGLSTRQLTISGQAVD